MKIIVGSKTRRLIFRTWRNNFRNSFLYRYKIGKFSFRFISISHLFNILNVVFWFNMQLNLWFYQALYYWKETGTSLKKPIWFHLLNSFSLTYWPIKLNCYHLILKRGLATYKYIYFPIDLLFEMKIQFHLNKKTNFVCLAN